MKMLRIILVALALISLRAYAKDGGDQITKENVGIGTADGQTFRDCPDCPEMVVIPAGSFNMGSSDGSNDEKPVHPVNIVRSFAMGKTEVTQKQWRAVMGSNPPELYFKNCGDDCPVEEVNRNDAKEFIRKLNAKTGKQYRLPSEAEWEYSARAGTTTAYYWGNDIGSNNANCDGCGSQWDSKQPAPAGSFKANAFGLYDMSGNVWEWVEDTYHGNYNDAPADGGAWQGKDAEGVLRGGSWINLANNLRSAIRYDIDPGNRNLSIGFRVARTLP